MLECFSSKKTVKIGYAPVRRAPANGPVFNLEEACYYKKLIEKEISGYEVEIVNMDDIDPYGILCSVHDASKVAEKFIAEKVDGVFIPHVNFGTEEAAARLAKMVGKPVLIWGPRDDFKEGGLRYRDSQCGMFASTKVLNMYGVPFTYIVNCDVTDDKFKKGFEKFLGVCNVVKAATHMRIGQIGVRPGPFLSVKMNEIQLLERFGFEIVPIAMTDLKEKFDACMAEQTDAIKAEGEALREKFQYENIEDEAFDTIACMKATLKKWAIEENLDCIATSCWAPMNNTFGISSCFVMSELTEMGIPCTCENDIHGAIGSVLTMAASRYASPTFLADLTMRHPENDNAELLWHCGVFPQSLARPDKPLEITRHQGRKKPGTGHWELKPGKLNLVRFDGFHDEYYMFLGEGHTTEGPETYGTYVWLEVDDWEKWEEKFMYGPYIHHCVGTYEEVIPVLEEACKYLPIKVDKP